MARLPRSLPGGPPRLNRSGAKPTSITTFPNDQDPHLFIDDDLTDGKPGKNMGLAFADPSDGSDCAVIRDLDGKFHIIYEDWSPINAGKHSWDSPLAGHSVSPNGMYTPLKIKQPAVDHRTKPTGKIGTSTSIPTGQKRTPRGFPRMWPSMKFTNQNRMPMGIGRRLA